MKIKDLPQGTVLKGQKVKTPNGVIGYYFSEFHGGVFLNNVKGDDLNDEGRLFPQIISKPEDVLKWDVITDESIPTNCDRKTQLKDILNK